MDYSPVILDPYGFTAPLAPHGIKNDDITGQNMRGIGPITGFPQSGYCVGYVHLFPCAINVSFNGCGFYFCNSIETPHAAIPLIVKYIVFFQRDNDSVVVSPFIVNVCNPRAGK
jgi:hypothetical protein